MNVRVLLVDGVSCDAALTSMQLQAAGASEVIQVSSVAEAKRHAPSAGVVVAELGRLDGAGLDMVRQLASAPALVVLVEEAEPSPVVRAVTAGADEVVVKGAGVGALRKAIQLAMARRQARDGLRTLVESNADAMIVFDESRTPVFANRAGEALLDIDARSVAASVRPGDVVTFALEQDVRARQWEARTSVVRWQGRPAWMCTVRDVTERRRDELRKLVHRDRLASIGELAAGVAHEINNPAAFVALNLESLEESARAGTLLADETTQRLLGECRGGVERITTIVRDLQAFARVEDDAGLVDLNDVVRVAASLTRNELEQRADLDLDLESLPRIRGEQTRLTQVVVNLLVNAAQAVEGHGDGHRIRVQTRVIGQTLVLRVKDTGSGIPDALRMRIFEPFFTTKERGIGTGLGLALCAETVRRHGGTIEACGDVGRGATFTVTLPVCAPEAIEAASEDDEPAALRVLVVDDEPLIRGAFGRILRGHDVVEAEDGVAAQRWLEDRAFDVVICDLMMPGMDGSALFEAVVERQPAYRDRFVFVTGGVCSDHGREFLARVRPLVLHKPVMRAELERAVHRAATLASGEDASS